ncbi:glucuronyl hydrolase [Mucilaginibacter terrae]|uniref:glucuronyl hydrolase n=1 Tax=Mucilaginibacter terrae TaxID=1955052 RepID=UPI0036255718
MNITKNYFLQGLLVITALFAESGCYAQNKKGGSSKNDLNVLIDQNLKEAAEQYQYFSTQIPADKLPKTLDDKGGLVTSGSDWWCSGFYPGTLLYLHEAKNNEALYSEALKKLTLLEKEQYNKGTHDLGFMMYCSFGNANRLQAKPAYKDILVNSARSLSTRFSPVVGCIRSWDKGPNQYIVIIDNMMNLELLFYATRVTGDSSYYKIAVSHANTTMKNHFRPDYSSYHVVDYNPQTGGVTLKRTHQGAADSSAWARGQGWGLYGYTLMYRETKDRKYLNQANHIAQFILNHPNLPADKVPYWDFNAPGIPNASRDVSAAALIASALIELSTYTSGKTSQNYLSIAQTIIRSLSTPEYRAAKGENGGFLLKKSVGSLPHKSEVDKPLTYADYYFVEAMVRYKDLSKNNFKSLNITTY